MFIAVLPLRVNRSEIFEFIYRVHWSAPNLMGDVVLVEISENLKYVYSLSILPIISLFCPEPSAMGLLLIVLVVQGICKKNNATGLKQCP